MDWVFMSQALLRDLAANRLRRLLSILGVIIGTGAVISSLAVVEGGRQQLYQQLEKLGANIVFLEDRYEPKALHDRTDPLLEHLTASPDPLTGLKHGRPETTPVRQRHQTLQIRDMAFLRKRFPGIEALEPQMVQWMQVGPVGERPFGCWVQGGTPAGAPIRGLVPAHGRYLCDNDLVRARRVCVVGARMATTLFGDRPALGQAIAMLGSRWEVVGVLEPKGNLMRFNYDDLVIVPLTTLQERTGLELINGVLISASDSQSAQQLRRDLPAVVLDRLPTRRPEAFRIFCQDELLKQKETLLQTFKILMVSIAAFSLLVSGIGIMNIMLVSVRERTSDIGIWKAVGATDEDVMIYFLAESIMTCTVGGLLGIGLGIFLGAETTGFIAGAIADTDGWVPVFRPTHMVLALATAMGVGLVSGLFPAMLAARLEPVEALRYE